VEIIIYLIISKKNENVITYLNENTFRLKIKKKKKKKKKHLNEKSIYL